MDPRLVNSGVAPTAGNTVDARFVGRHTETPLHWAAERGESMADEMTRFNAVLGQAPARTGGRIEQLASHSGQLRYTVEGMAATLPGNAGRSCPIVRKPTFLSAPCSMPCSARGWALCCGSVLGLP